MVRSRWRYFRKDEFTCKCGCGLNNIDTYFVDKLDQARTRAGFKFVINSGCRCKEHNEAVGGTPESEHLTGQGADIRIMSDYERWMAVTSLIAVGIRRIGVADTYVHAGNGVEYKAAPRMWVYSE